MAGLLALGTPLALWARSRWLDGHSRSLLGFRDPLARLVEWKLGGYRVPYTVPDPAKPARLGRSRRVAVLGSGLAGLGAAEVLAERGWEVVVFEKNPYLGGKIGAWDDELSDGTTDEVAHGFHAFFRHYWNLNGFLDRTGVREHLTPVADYQILGLGGRVNSFRAVDTVPALNLISLGSHGFYRISELLGSRAVDELDAFLRFHPERTEHDFDHVPFSAFVDFAEVPASLMLSFNTFSRAFFSDPERLSTAELIKSFHFYYLSHAEGLLYDYPADAYSVAVLGPIHRHLEGLGVSFRLGCAVESLEGGDGFLVNGERFDDVVVACNASASRAILDTDWFRESAPETAAKVETLASGQRYCVYRAWFRGRLAEQVTNYVVIDRERVLDAVAQVDQIEETSRSWARENGGTVLELHSYAVPDDLPDEEVRSELLRELELFFPSASKLELIRDHQQLRQDFTAFHVGMASMRPETDTGISGLKLAGDWVKLPFPAMLMEGAYSAGVLAANRLAVEQGVAQAPLHSVPPLGLLDGVPRPPSLRGGGRTLDEVVREHQERS